MTCKHCGLTDTIDSIVFLPSRPHCSRCRKKPSAKDLQAAVKFYPWGRTLLPLQK